MQASSKSSEGRVGQLRRTEVPSGSIGEAPVGVVGNKVTQKLKNFGTYRPFNPRTQVMWTGACVNRQCSQSTFLTS